MLKLSKLAKKFSVTNIPSAIAARSSHPNAPCISSLYQFHSWGHTAFQMGQSTLGQRHYGSEAAGRRSERSFLDEAYIQKFGKVKSDLLDTWLELSNESLIKECEKMDLPTTGKHIENMQSLFDYLKKFEVEVSSIKDVGSSQNQDTRSRPPSSEQNFDNPRGSRSGQNESRQSDPPQKQWSNTKTSQTAGPPPEKRQSRPRFGRGGDQYGGGWQESDLGRSTEMQQSRSQHHYNQSQKSGQKYSSHEDLAIYEKIEGGSNTYQKMEKYNKTVTPLQFGIDRIIACLKTRRGINEQYTFPQTSYVSNQQQAPIKTGAPLKFTKKYSNTALSKAYSSQNPNDVFNALVSSQGSILGKMSLSLEDFNSLEDSKKRLALLRMIDIDSEYNERHNVREHHEFPVSATERTALINNGLTYQSLAFYARQVDIQTEELKMDIEMYKLKVMLGQEAKKAVLKKNIPVLSFEDKIRILNILPSVAGHTYLQQNRSLNHALLSSIFKEQYEPAWETLSKDRVFLLLNKCNELEKCRDIQNKIRAALTLVPTETFSVDDFQRLLKTISEGKPNNIDARLLTIMTRRSLKSFAYMPNGAEFTKFVDFFSYLYKTNPLLMTFIHFELKYILTRASQLAQQEEIKFNDMLKMANIVVPSLYKPAFFFTEMINSPRGSFKTEADKQLLLELVDQITLRIGQGDMVFEHLEMSTSRLHQNYRPYTEETFLVLQKILQDLIQPNSESTQEGGKDTVMQTASANLLSVEELRVANKIFQCEPLMLKLFRSSSQAIELTVPIIDSQLAHVKEQLKTESKRSATSLLENNVDVAKWEDQFKAISNIQPIIQSSQDLVQKSYDLVEHSLKLLNHEINHYHELRLDDLLKLNRSVLKALERFPVLVKQYQETSPLFDVAKQTLEFFFLDKKPSMQKFEKARRNTQVAKSMLADTNQYIIDNHIGAFINLLRITNGESFKVSAINLVRDIKNVRSLMSEDLINLFLLIDKYSLNLQAAQTIINVAPNLMTVDQRRILTRFSSEDVQDVNFQREQAKRAEKDKEIKKLIFNKYYGLFMNDPQSLNKPEIVLGPLSYLVADIFDDFTDQEILDQLRLLSSDKLDNYNSLYIKKLYGRYSKPAKIEEMWQNNPRFFFGFAKHWPHFLKNNAILSVLTHIKSSSSVVTEQAETLSILTKKNVLHPELIESHFETFIKMKDKSSVSKYLQDFMASCAYLGYADIDMEMLTQVFRRIYKTANEVSVSQLLNYLVMLSLSEHHYPDFDEKSARFVEEAIERVENAYTGVEVIEIKERDPLTGEDEVHSLDFFKPILTENKVYNKVVIKAKEPKLFFKKVVTDVEEDEDSSTEDADELEKARKVPEKQQEMELTGDLDSLDLPVLDADKLILESEREVVETLESPTGLQEDVKVYIEDPNDPFAVRGDRVKTAERDHPQTMREKIELPIYERKASEGLYSEELEFHQYRKKKLINMDRKSKHLLLFSNINQLNFVDVNQQDVVKAWAVLFHFKNKSLESVLYDEFQSITMRNCIGKNKGHELYNKFYMSLIDRCFKFSDVRVVMTTRCEKTGWPIDLAIKPVIKGPAHRRYAPPPFKQLALFFFLQEEICYNAKIEDDEPLGLQKLMMKHLLSHSDYRLDYVTENDFYFVQKDKDGVKKFVDEIMFTNFDVLPDDYSAESNSKSQSVVI